jgi:hypothetical protein
MPLTTLLSKYMTLNATVLQTRRERVSGVNSYNPVNNTDAAPLQMTIWPLTQMWRLKNRGQALEDQFGYALSDPAYDLKAGDVLQGYPGPTDKLEVGSVNIIDVVLSPVPHLSGILRRYTHQG